LNLPTMFYPLSIATIVTILTILFTTQLTKVNLPRLRRDGNASTASHIVASSSYGQNSNSKKHNIVKGVLLPVAMDLLRRGYPVDTVYNFGPTREFEGECSCRNPRAEYECCERRIRRAHKMGTVMTKKMFDKHRIKKPCRPYEFAYHDRLPDVDYRDVLLMRNIYDSLVSGYLFHQLGHECDSPTHKGEEYLRSWHTFISYHTTHKNRTLCQYLAEEEEEEGMRVYMEWVFRYHYGPNVYSHWALSQGIPEIKERTKVVCYEDMMNPEKDMQTINSMLTFWFNGTSYEPWEGVPPGHFTYTGNHSTPSDPALRGHLKDVVKQIDEKYYHGEVAWANSVLPC